MWDSARGVCAQSHEQRRSQQAYGPSSRALSRATRPYRERAIGTATAGAMLADAPLAEASR